MNTRSSNAPAVAQTHCNSSASISHCVTTEQAPLPVHSVNNHKASGGGSVLIDSNSTGSSTPNFFFDRMNITIASPPIGHCRKILLCNSLSERKG
jgi:hypothetical protein